MQIGQFDFPDELLYDPEKHLWFRFQGDVVEVGMTSLGQYMAGKIFQVTVKGRGEEVSPRSVVFSLESAKWIGKFRLPLEREVVEYNEEVVRNPSLLNSSPYSAWIVRIKVRDAEKSKSKLKSVEEAKGSFENEVKRLVRR
jgi:glycine cleavage system H protein